MCAVHQLEHRNYYSTINCLMHNPVLYGLLHIPQLPITPYHVQQLLNFVQTSQGYMVSGLRSLHPDWFLLVKVAWCGVNLVARPLTAAICQRSGITMMPHAPLDVFHPLVTLGRTPTTAFLPSVSVFHVDLSSFCHVPIAGTVQFGPLPRVPSSLFLQLVIRVRPLSFSPTHCVTSMPAAHRTRKATTKAAPGTTIDSSNTPSPDEHPSTKGSDAKVDEGLGPVVDSDSKKALSRCQGKAKRGMGFGYGDSGSTDNRVAPNGGGPSTQVKAVVPTRALPNRPGCNVHPAGQPKPPQRNKEQIEADRKVAQKALEEKLHNVWMAKEHLVQLNVMEEDKEDDLHLLHLQCLSTAIHKQCHIDVESDDERFDLREADNGSNPDDSSSESNEATKTKTKSRNKHVKGAAHQELLTRTEDLRGAKHTKETRRQQKSTHDIGRFTAQDLCCKKYANSGLRLQAPSLAPPNATLNATLLQQPDVTDPLELGGLGDSKPQATRKPPCHKSKAVKAIVKKDSKHFTEAQPNTHPDIAHQCLDDSPWTCIFLLTLSHTLYISDHPFTDWTRESSTLVETVQVAFELSFTNISYTLSAQDGIVKAAYDQMKTRWSKIASDVLMLVKTFFEHAEFKDQPEKIKDYVHWALKAGGPAYYENPVPKSSKLRKDDPNYTKPNGFLCSQFILPVAKTYLGFASRSVLHPILGAKSPPRGLYVMILTAVEHAMRAYLTGFLTESPRKTWGLVPQYCSVFGLGQASRGSAISVSRSHNVTATHVSIPSIPSLPYRSLAHSIHPPSFLPRLSFSCSSFLATTQTDNDDDADDLQDGL
ncbi:hypothetical protein EDB83DRAFT_2315525 [Lactarius deliciosus]|nr:hypothetical protein EDB83DRAFT_2315525 [Lactarius deliciosus]